MVYSSFSCQDFTAEMLSILQIELIFFKRRIFMYYAKKYKNASKLHAVNRRKEDRIFIMFDTETIILDAKRLYC